MNWYADEKFAKSVWLMVLLALVVGIGGGVGAAVFHWLILSTSFTFYAVSDTSTFLNTVTQMPWYVRVIIPTLGGLFVGLILFPKKVRAAYGDGVPEVMEAIILERGKIVPWIAPLKAIVSAISIGSGGAGGREGPIIQIGSAIGSTVGQWAKLPTADTRVLLAAGAAAGIAGTFSAPLAGVVFAGEILLRRLTVRRFLIIGLAAVVGELVATQLLGLHGPLLKLPAAVAVVPVSIWWMLVLLTIISAAVALLFSYTLRWCEQIFAGLSMPLWLRPALGGLLLGVLSLFIPQVHELGAYTVMEQVITSPLSWMFAALFLLGKILATSLTIGSGGSGGVFAPSLFIGTMTGAMFGMVMLFFIPKLGVSPAFFAIIGMGAVFAGATHAPLTAVVILVEMTHSYELALPLVFVCLASAWITKKVRAGSIYTAPLLDEGINPSTPR